MKGLFLKELKSLRRYVKTMVVLLVFYTALAFFQGTDGGSFLSGIIVMLAVLMSVTSFTYDDFYHWDRYALTLPLTRRDLVRSKYLFALVLIGTAALFALAASVLLSLSGGGEGLLEAFASVGGSLIAAVFLISLMIPFIYRFGSEKARLMLAAVAVVPTAALFISYRLGIRVSEAAVEYALFAAVPAVLLMFYLSYRISLSIYERKEF